MRSIPDIKYVEQPVTISAVDALLSRVAYICQGETHFVEDYSRTLLDRPFSTSDGELYGHYNKQDRKTSAQHHVG